MSIEIYGFNKSDNEAVSELASLACRLCVASGTEGYKAYTSGDSGATYAAEIAFTTLRQMGLIPEEGIDLDKFRAVAQSVFADSLTES